jgi:hypothetical protein
MAKTRVTLSLDDDVLRSVRISAARKGKRDSEVVEDALREYLGFGVIERIRAQSEFTHLSEDEVMELVNAEVHAYREGR